MVSTGDDLARSDSDREQVGVIVSAVASMGAAFIHLLVRLFGKTVSEAEVPWLLGPTGGEYIADKPYEEWAKREGLSVERHAQSGGLISSFDSLSSPSFDAARVDPRVRHFYEHTAGYRMDVWAESSFPANIGLWLLVTTISRKVNQLNFPLRVLESAKGMTSEMVLLKDDLGSVRYAGWYRRLVESKRVIYTGFYLVARMPHDEKPAVKVVFPMPQGNATVILRPHLAPDGSFELSSAGANFGDVGFYRVQRRADGRLRVWHVRSLKEHFRVYVDDAGTLRCDHGIRFLGLRVLHLHYRIEPLRAATAPER